MDYYGFLDKLSRQSRKKGSASLFIAAFLSLGVCIGLSYVNLFKWSAKWPVTFFSVMTALGFVHLLMRITKNTFICRRRIRYIGARADKKAVILKINDEYKANELLYYSDTHQPEILYLLPSGIVCVLPKAVTLIPADKLLWTFMLEERTKVGVEYRIYFVTHDVKRKNPYAVFKSRERWEEANHAVVKCYKILTGYNAAMLKAVVKNPALLHKIHQDANASDNVPFDGVHFTQGQSKRLNTSAGVN